MENYKEIELYFGSIEEAIDLLNYHKKKGDLVFINFNGQKLYSDVDDLDSAYKKITGKNKLDFDKHLEEDRIKRDLEEQEYLDSIPQLTKEWVERGDLILDAKYKKLWEKCVPIRLGDLYRGMELGCTLDLVDKLNNGIDFTEIEDDLKKQGHSGMSFGLMCSMLKSFCDRGNEFVEFVKKTK